MTAQLRLASRVWDPADYVFCNIDGSPLHPRTPHRIWQRIVAASGVKYLKPLAQRHTHATLLLEEGVPLHVVAKRLGHRDAMVTATIYAHVTPKQEDAAAGVYGEWLRDDEVNEPDAGETGC
jgi:integrase